MKNVLVIHADQHRQDCIGAYGNREIITPNLDALAADGMRHTAHFCSYPLCTPSRHALLSGMYAHQSLCWTNQCTLPQGYDTFASSLRRNGYKTACVGKMHLSPTYHNLGFDTMVLSEQDGPGRFDDDYHRGLMEDGLIDDIDLTDQHWGVRRYATPEYYDNFGAQVSDLPEGRHSTDFITENAVKQLEGWDSGGGNLLFVGYIKPHHPFDPPARYAAMYNPGKLTLPEGYTPDIPAQDADRRYGYFDNARLTPERLRRVMAMYYATITHIDDGVGAMVRKLREKGLYEDTLIVYTSDHGELLGHHHLLLKGGTTYDPIMKIPLLIKYPGGAQRGVCDSLSSNVDVAKVILSVCGAESPKTMSCRGLTSREAVLCESYTYRDNTELSREYTLRTTRYKLVMTGSAEHVVLFDLQNDPHELCDVAGLPEYADALGHCKALLYEEILFAAPSRAHLCQEASSIGGEPYAETVRKRLPVMRYFKDRSAAWSQQPDSEENT